MRTLGVLEGTIFRVVPEEPDYFTLEFSELTSTDSNTERRKVKIIMSWIDMKLLSNEIVITAENILRNNIKSHMSMFSENDMERIIKDLYSSLGEGNEPRTTTWG